MDARTSLNQAKYNDIVFFLLAIPFINALNYYLTYSNIAFSSHTLLTFFIDTLEGYAAWWGFRSVILYLDKKMPYDANPLKRILIQLIFSSATGLLIIIALTEIINRIAKDTAVPANFYLHDIFIFLIWFFVLNGIYIGLHYYQAMKHIEKLRFEEKKIKSEGFSVKDGRQNLLIAFDTIVGFFTDGEYTALITNESKKYLIDKSLDKIEQSLPAESFFRLNRQYIVHRNAIQGFIKIENGKLNVLIISLKYLPREVQVSRTKAAAFKNWFQPG